MELRRVGTASALVLATSLAVGAAWISTPAQAATVAYSYDTLGRVTGANYGNCTNITYTYDSAGNRTQVAGEQAPKARNRTASTVKNTAQVFNPASNATDPDPGDVLTITSATNPPHGSTSVGAGNQVTYTPDTNYVGTDSYDYTITDGHTCATGGAPVTSTATVTITVTAS